MILCSKLKNGLCKIVTKSQVVTKFNVSKSRLHCKSVSTYEKRVISLSTIYLGSNKNWDTILINKVLQKLSLKEDFDLEK